MIQSNVKRRTSLSSADRLGLNSSFRSSPPSSVTSQ